MGVSLLCALQWSCIASGVAAAGYPYFLCGTYGGMGLRKESVVFDVAVHPATVYFRSLH